MQRLIGRLFLVFTLFAFPALAWGQPKMTEWDQDHPLPAQLGPFALSSSRMPATGDNEGAVILHVTDAQGHKTDLKVEIAFDDVYASVGVGSIDPGSSKPQLLVTSYTGGAHCCVHIQVLDYVDGRWRTVDVGTFDGEPFTAFPADVDGDGITDIQRWDDRFAYAFGCYACSWMPPRLFNIRDGKLQDVSAAPRYQPLYLKDYDDAKEKCANAACAGLVADGYRLGRADEAWSIAMANIDPNDAWLPGCKVKATNYQCPEGQDYHPGEFRAALAQFLLDQGITPTVR
jgi:hypothetical protein